MGWRASALIIIFLVYIAFVKLEYLGSRDFVLVFGLIQSLVLCLKGIRRLISQKDLILLLLGPKLMVLDVFKNILSMPVREINSADIDCDDPFLKRMEDLFHFLNDLVSISVNFVNFILSELHHVLDPDKGYDSAKVEVETISKPAFLNEDDT